MLRNIPFCLSAWNRPLPYRSLTALVLLATLALAACASREELQTISPRNPQNTNLSGLWSLRGEPGPINERIQRAIRETDGIRNEQIIQRARNNVRNSRRSDGRAKGGLVHVFFENGENLKITQTDSGLFVSFDRAIVEEYRFGENRLIQVGQAEGQRVSGWKDGDYVIETLDRSGMKLTERYQLAANGQTLTRRITFRSRTKESVTIVQLFARDQ